jgi:nitrite reductase/ring-hydroxylating ferredoxin subunit
MWLKLVSRQEEGVTKMKVSIAIGLLLALLLPVLASCTSQASAAGNGTGKSLNGTFQQITVKAAVSGDTVTVPLSDVQNNRNVNFRVNTANDYYVFMAYQYGDQTYVRADVCVPCGSESFTLKNATLVCNSCGTIFDAKTGAGVSGNLGMKWADMAAAYQKTTTPAR